MTLVILMLLDHHAVAYLAAQISEFTRDGDEDATDTDFVTGSSFQGLKVPSFEKHLKLVHQIIINASNITTFKEETNRLKFEWD